MKINLISHLTIILFLAAICNLYAQNNKRYEIDPKHRHYQMFCALPRTEKTERFRKIIFTAKLPENCLVFADDAASERVLCHPRKTAEHIIAAKLQSSSVSNTAFIRARGVKLCLMTAKNINDVITALNLAPDYLLISPDLDMKRIKTELMKPEHNTELKGFCNNFPLPPERTPGTVLRVMSYNILATRWGRNMPPFSHRMPGIIKVIRNAAPDIIGLQEVEPEWYDILAAALPEYSFAIQPYTAGAPPVLFTATPFGEMKNPPIYKSTMNGILYKKDRFRELDGGVMPYTDTIIRCLRWTLLEDVKSGKRCIMTNTHWNLTIPKRRQNSELMVHYIKQLRNRFPGVPVICTGDFNCKNGSRELKFLLDNAKLYDSATAADKVENSRVFSAFPQLSHTLPLVNNQHIDHVIFSEEFKALESKLLISRELFDYSDHLPLNVDLKFNR